MAEQVQTTDQSEQPSQEQQNQPVALEWLPETDTIDLVDNGKTVTSKLREVKTLSKFKTASDLARGYVRLEKLATSSIRLPGANASKDEVAAFREKLGVPKDAAGYGIKYDDLKVPDRLKGEFNAESLDETLAWAHEHGFTKKQVEAMLARSEQRLQGQEQTAEEVVSRAKEQALVAMKKEWGADTARNVALVQRGVKEIAGEEYAVYLEETGLGNDPRHLRFLHRVFVPLMEDGVVSGASVGSVTSADAAAEIKKLMDSDEYKSKDRNVRLPVVERIRELSNLAFSE